MTSYNFEFSLRYYPAYQGYYGSRSGVSVFRPAVNISKSFSNLSDIYYQVGSICSQITLKYFNKTTNESAIATAKIFPDSTTIEWRVTIDEIPLSIVGKEVTVNWKLQDFDNAGIFYTDTNGLEM